MPERGLDNSDYVIYLAKESKAMNDSFARFLNEANPDGTNMQVVQFFAVNLLAQSFMSLSGHGRGDAQPIYGTEREFIDETVMFLEEAIKSWRDRLAHGDKPLS